jgi:hypothetical protein
MRNKLFYGVLAAGLIGLAACGGPSGCASIDRPVAGQTVVDEKTLYGLTAGYFGIEAAAEAAADSGLLKPGSEEALRVANGLVKARQAVIVARSAYRAGDAAGSAEKLAAAQSLIGEVWTLIPTKKDPLA